MAGVFSDQGPGIQGFASWQFSPSLSLKGTCLIPSANWDQLCSLCQRPTP